ncbi:MAG TPA: type I polyketide synthase, partial [Nitrospira sp.]
MRITFRSTSTTQGGFGAVERPRRKRVAVISYSFRFPQTDPSEFWNDLLAGRDFVTRIPRDRWGQDVYVHPDRKHPGTTVTFAAGSLGDVSGFDAEFFGVSPREAVQMDPQQRLLLEMSWEALENGGVRPSSLRSSNTAVFMGIASTDYVYRLVEDIAACDASSITGNAVSIAANRISYVFDLHGPSMAIDTACSSALVAFHQACNCILSGESTMALAGGISLHLHPFSFVGFSKASMLSTRGRCRVFDASGDGYVRSEGGGVFLLKDYDQAVEDGDPILAVVAATAINTDGHKSGLTVPSKERQAELLQHVYGTSGLTPHDLDYVEAHGTGTAIGDPIEAGAIGEALGRFRSRGQPLWIGSVKSNLGHLETASGVAGLVKALLCLRHRVVPGTIGIQQVNPRIPLSELNLDVVTENRPLKTKGRLVVGVNSFGFGGVNAHVALESDGSLPPPEQHDARVYVPVLISGKTAEALNSAVMQWVEWLKRTPSAPWRNVAYNSLFRREWHPHRVVTFAESANDLAHQLDRWLSGDKERDLDGPASGTALGHPIGPIFVYTGNGAQWGGMGNMLLQDQVFLSIIREIDEHFLPLAGFSLERELAGLNGVGDRYADTEISQPAMFAVQVGITKMVRQLGVEPLGVVGHSVGEVAAAWACGALSLQAATAVIFHRSQAQGKTKGMGGMRAVALGHDEMQDLVNSMRSREHLCIAAINSPNRVTVSGSYKALAELETLLDRRGIACRRVDVEYPFHSPFMDAIQDTVCSALQTIQPESEALPYYSTVVGGRLEGVRLNGQYWWDNIRKPVRFGEAIHRMQVELGSNLFLEIGPLPVLRSYIKDCLEAAGREGTILPTLVRHDDDPRRVRRSAALCILKGGTINREAHFPQPLPFVQLPNYPWQRERYWHRSTRESQGALDRRTVHLLLGFALPHHEWTWESHLDTVTHPFLADHRIGGVAVFPGAAFVELALAATMARVPGQLIEIDNLEIHAPMVLDAEHVKLVRSVIDGEDGRFTIQSRTYVSDEAWTRHATGRSWSEAGERPLSLRDCAVPTRHPDFTAEDHYRATQSAGLAYGTAFQCVRHGWFEKDGVWAALGSAPGMSPSDLAWAVLSPALLDGAFQLVVELLRESRETAPGIAYVPTRCGRIRCRTTGERPVFARATLNARHPHSLIAEFHLFGADGKLVASIEDAQFRRMSLPSSPRRQIRHLVEHLVPSPKITPMREALASDTGSVAQSLRRVLGSQELTSPLRRFGEEIEPLIEVLCEGFVHDALSAFVTEQERQSAFTHGPMMHHLLRQALEDGAVVVEGGVWRVGTKRNLPISVQDLWKSLVEDYPDHGHLIHAIGRVGFHLPGLLRDDVSAETACPPLSSFSHLLDDALAAEGRWRIAQGLRAVLDDMLTELPSHGRLGVLHMSHLKPRFARDLCRAINFDRCDYVFASHARDVVEAFEEIRTGYPLAHVHFIHGPEPMDRLYDLAILDQDHYDESTIQTSLDYAVQHLAPNGTFILLGWHPARWLDFLFASRGGWLKEGTAGVLRTPLRPAHYWADRLRALGCGEPDLVECASGAASGA